VKEEYSIPITAALLINPRNLRCDKLRKSLKLPFFIGIYHAWEDCSQVRTSAYEEQNDTK